MSDTCPVRPLICHPSTHARELDGIAAGVEFAGDGHVVFHYRLRGEIARLRIPAPQAPARADGLWEHTCCEAFVALPAGSAYREFNFSPSGQWAIYDFSAYRQRLADPVADAPRIAVRHDSGYFELAVRVPRALLPGAGPWDIGLCVVAETGDALSYWALHHPSPRPDFHHREGFAIRLDPG